MIFFWSQEKAYKQEDRLIAKLQELEMDSNLVGVLRRQAIVLLDGGPTSGLGLGVHRDSIPMHTFARFLFVALLDYYPDLAYDVGLRAMRYVITTDPRYHRITAVQMLVLYQLYMFTLMLPLFRNSPKEIYIFSPRFIQQVCRFSFISILTVRN